MISVVKDLSVIACALSVTMLMWIFSDPENAGYWLADMDIAYSSVMTSAVSDWDILE